uniref:GNAT family N-acetyltransferase n=1 Tax=Wolbachia endosymbiont of Pentidionis agamae TaxID=3110435 RepID=UPI002FD0FBF2
SPKKAILILKNYLLPNNVIPGLKFNIVNSHDHLLEFDSYTSKIFHHDIGIVSTFLRGLSNSNNSGECGLKFFLVKLNDNVIGTCGMYTKDDVVGFYSDGIMPEYRNQRIGTQMVIERIKMAQALKCKYVVAHCMQASVSLYKRLGFRMLGNIYLSSLLT